MESFRYRRIVRGGVRLGSAVAILTASITVATAVVGSGGDIAHAAPTCTGESPVSITGVSQISSSSSESITLGGCAIEGHSVYVDVFAGSRTVATGSGIAAPDTGGDWLPPGCALPSVHSAGTCKRYVPLVPGGEWSLTLTVPANCLSSGFSQFEIVASQPGWSSLAAQATAPDLVASSSVCSIGSVSVTGTSVAPTITINGSGFGTQPTGTPAGCDDPSNDLDYGQNLYIVDNTRQWNAGDGEACIGLENVSWTNTMISFELGPIYDTSDLVLDANDSVTVFVEGASFTTTVSYATTITGVTYLPSSANSAIPTITIYGSDFGPIPPGETAGCGDPSGDNDYYNDDLWINDATGKWEAGKPGACVGLESLSWTNTVITFTVGPLYGSNNWVFNPGDSVTVFVEGAWLYCEFGMNIGCMVQS